jgi:hypothetical protein
MARYYFNFKTGDTSDTDDEGMDFPNLSAAVREAELAAYWRRRSKPEKLRCRKRWSSRTILA